MVAIIVVSQTGCFALDNLTYSLIMSPQCSAVWNYGHGEASG